MLNKDPDNNYKRKKCKFQRNYSEQRSIYFDRSKPE